MFLYTAWMACQWVEDRVFGLSAEELFRMPRVQWRSLSQVSPYLVKAVLAGEDQRFLTPEKLVRVSFINAPVAKRRGANADHGFSLIELRDAVEDLVTTHRTRGASSISMQVLRTVFLWPSRRWFRELVEAC